MKRAALRSAPSYGPINNGVEVAGVAMERFVRSGVHCVVS